MAVIARGNADAEQEKATGGKQVQPAKMLGCKLQSDRGPFRQQFGIGTPQPDKSHQQNQRRAKDPAGKRRRACLFHWINMGNLMLTVNCRLTVVDGILRHSQQVPSGTCQPLPEDSVKTEGNLLIVD